jgi:hypothetical protein
MPASTVGAYWIYWVTPDSAASTGLCVLYGQALDASGLPTQELVQVALEQTGATSGAASVSDAPVTVLPSALGSWAVALYPSAALVPAGMYRVTVGAACWRGPLPTQASISLGAWVALSTTVRVY